MLVFAESFMNVVINYTIIFYFWGSSRFQNTHICSVTLFAMVTLWVVNMVSLAFFIIIMIEGPLLALPNRLYPLLILSPTSFP